MLNWLRDLDQRRRAQAGLNRGEARNALARAIFFLIRERTSAGLKAAEARGKKGGRKPVVTPDKLARARAHLAAGLTVREAAARVKVGKTALYEALGASATGPKK